MRARIAYDNQSASALAVNVIVDDTVDDATKQSLFDGMTSIKWAPLLLSSSVEYIGTFSNVDYIALAGVNWQTAGCKLTIRSGGSLGTIIHQMASYTDNQPAIIFLDPVNYTNLFFQFDCFQDSLEVGEIYFGQSIILPRSVSVGYQPARWRNNDEIISSKVEKNYSFGSIIKSRDQTERFNLEFLDINFLETVFKTFMRDAEGLPIFFIWDTLNDRHVVFGKWSANDPSFTSQNFSSISMTVDGQTDLTISDGTLLGSQGGNSAGFGSDGFIGQFVPSIGSTDGGGNFAGGGGGGSFSFRTSVNFNNAIDFWTLDEVNSQTAENAGKGGGVFTKEVLDYNPISLGVDSSSINDGAGRSKNLQAFTNRTLSGSTIDSGTVFSRSDTWGIEFALLLTTSTSNDIVLSFWDSASLATDGIDKLFKIYVDPVDSDVLLLDLYTTNNDSSFTLRSNVIVPSISGLAAGWNYYSIFFISQDTLICRINDVETLNIDVSSWETRLSGIHTSAKFRIGADMDSPVANVMNAKIDEVSTYASVTGVNFDTSRTYDWWANKDGPPPPTISGIIWSAGNTQSDVRPSVSDDSSFGQSISLASSTKDRVVIGAPNKNFPSAQDGEVQIFFFDGLSWSLEQIIPTQRISSEARSFGAKVEINELGDKILILDIGSTSLGIPQPSQIYYFTRSGSSWTLQQTIFSNIINNQNQADFSVSKNFATIFMYDGNDPSISQTYDLDIISNTFSLSSNQIPSPPSGSFSFQSSFSQDGTVFIYAVLDSGFSSSITMFDFNSGWSVRESINLSALGYMNNGGISIDLIGDIFAWGAGFEQIARIYSWNGSNYVEQITPLNSNYEHSAISSDGLKVSFSGDTSQTTDVSEFDSGIYNLPTIITPSFVDPDGIGYSQSCMSSDGRMIVIGQKDFDSSGNNDNGRFLVYEAI